MFETVFACKSSDELEEELIDTTNINGLLMESCDGEEWGFDMVTDKEIKETPKSQNKNVFGGASGITSKFLRLCTQTVLAPMALLNNLCIENIHFTKDLNIGNVFIACK